MPHGREERRTARDGTQGPKKERAVPTAGKVVISSWKSSCYLVGESGDRSVREILLQQAEKNEDSESRRRR